jgi:hypothetical protein
MSKSKKLSVAELDRIGKMLQNAQWHLSEDFCTSELVTYDDLLITIAKVNEKALCDAADRKFYCDDVEIEFLDDETKPLIILHLLFLRDEDDELDSVETYGVDADLLLRYFMTRQYIEENKLKVKVSPQVQKMWRQSFTEAVRGLQAVLKQKELV